MPLLSFISNRKAEMRSQKLIFSEFNRLSVTPAPILRLTLGLGVVISALLNTNISGAIAQIPITPAKIVQSERIISQANILFVNPSIGNDQGGNGSEIAPVKTITKALQLAQANTLIVLAPGTYSLQTGEAFPIILKPSIAIQGDHRNQGRSVKIIGGGEYLSRSFGRQNVAIVGANQASLSGVTVTNTNNRGYGLWIESTNPIVQENTFTGNTQDGIATTGNATPTISKNYFHQNGANGITVSGESRPDIRENVFQNTGFAINVAQNAAPVIVGNQITNNRSGIVVQANTSPILRNNVIQSSKEDGLVVIAQATPDLGTISEPGGNKFWNNGRYDINAKAAKQVIFAGGNNLSKNRIIGNVDINATRATIVSNSAPNSVYAQEIPTGREMVFAAPSIPKTFNQSTVILSKRSNPPENNPIPKITPTNLQNSLPITNFQSNTPQLNYVRIEPAVIQPTAFESEVAESGVIEFVAPQASISSPRNAGNSGVVLASTPYATTPQSSRYRVVVPVTNNQQREIVLSVVPDAFPKVSQGRTVMQVGAFSTQENAREMVQIFNSRGLIAIIERLN
ncbi:DUF1565 domain-containing protein [Sphaerospermopsis aphanizomenoides BCCUSP55]|uniref:DUF1565 domain-containing protein n=1 Tax=Sphaerospermopsis aphanizomenoides TaxID=459663 RepID=UPI000A542FC8|nr:DUF1565 domain-containing protein [Sphaerospermopsis aphanizomenoides]MBK1987544.1 DUF1565 domain-containing protein [Sphaerospermopsis aphanizomenoides BCCUSP55]